MPPTIDWNARLRRLLVGSMLVELGAVLAKRLPAPFMAAAVPIAIVGLAVLVIGLALLGLARWGESHRLS